MRVPTRLLVTCLCILLFLGAPSWLLADEFLAPIVTSGVPATIAVDPVSNRIYVADASSAKIFVVDGQTHAVVQTYAPDAPCQFLAIDPVRHRLFAAQNATSDCVLFAFDETGTRLMTVNENTLCTGLACNSHTGNAYATLATGQVDVFDSSFTKQTVNLTLTGTIQMALNAATGAVYVLDDGTNVLYRIDPDTLAFTSSTITSACVSLAVDPAADQVYVSVPGNLQVRIYKGDLTGYTPVPLATTGTTIVCNPATHRAYVGANDANGLRVIDGLLGQVIGNVPTVTSGNVMGINATTNRVYVGDTSFVRIVNGSSLAVQALPNTGAPSTLAVNPVTNRIYLGTNAATGAVKAIDGATQTAVAVVLPTSDYGRVAVNPQTDRVFGGGFNGVIMFDALTNDQPVQLYSALPVGDISIDTAANRVYAVGPSGVGGSFLRVVNPDVPNFGFNTNFAGGATSAPCVDEGLRQAYLITRETGPEVLRVNVISPFGFVIGSLGTNDPSLNITFPISSAVNPATHKVYYSNGYTFFAFDPLHGTPYSFESRQLAPSANTATSTPQLVAIDSLRNIVYVASYGDGLNPGTLFAVPGDGSPETAIPVQVGPMAVAVDESTRTIYVANRISNSLTIVDGATNNTVTLPLPAGFGPIQLAFEPRAGVLFLGGANGEVRVLKAGGLSGAVAVAGGNIGNFAINPVNGNVYAGETTTNEVLAVSSSTRAESGLVSFIGPLSNDEAVLGNSTSLSLGSLSLYGPQFVPPRKIYYQFDSMAGPWLEPPLGDGAEGQVFLSDVGAGYHTLHTFATDGQEGGSGASPAGTAGITGQVTSYRFLVRPGAFSFSTSLYQALDTAGSAVITISRDFDAPASVAYATRNASAVAGTNYTKTTGVLQFGQDERSKTISVPVLDTTGGPASVFFELELSDPSDGARIAGDGHAHVLILDAQSPDLTLSQRAQIAPDSAPDATGALTVTLTPPEANGQWRLFGEVNWRNSGTTINGLVAANYSVEYKPVANFTAPPLETVPVDVDEAQAVLAAYVGGQNVTPGALSVTLAGVASGVGGWRLQGEQAFRASGDSVSGLNPGRYIVEFQSVAGRATPPKRVVEVPENATAQISATYFIAEPTTGAAPSEYFSPVVVQFDAPGQFSGQIQTDAGVGTGFVPLDRVVATCAHVLFDDVGLSYVPGVRWYFQHYVDRFETPPQFPRGTYIFEGYASQRATDNTPGESSAASRQLDVAAMYFFEPAARGGSSGYLASNSATNTWLTGTRTKRLSGYAVEGVLETSIGKPFVTPNFSTALTNVGGALFSTTAVHGLPGMSGGALWVLFDDFTTYPAAIYLGGNEQTLVRAIDAQVVDIFNRAESSANGGANNVGGGISLVNNGVNGSTTVAFGSLRVGINPAGVNTAGARWRIATQTTQRRSNQTALGVPPGTYTVTFNAVSGYTTPANQQVSVVSGQELVAQATYVPSDPPAITSAASARGVVGQGFSYRITATFDPGGFGATGLPDGLSLNANTGVISGRPTTAGDFTVTLAATNGAGTGNGSLQITIAMPGQLITSVVGSGTVLKKFAGTTTQAVGSLLKVKATPAKNFLFESWSDAETGAVLSNQSTYEFTMPPHLALKATFVPNLFVPGKGTYLGLLRGGTRELSGLLKLTVMPSGVFSAQLQLGGSPATIVNSFSARGHFASAISLADTRAFLLTLDLASGGTVTGTLTDSLGGGAVAITALRSVTAAPKALVGSYTAKLTPGDAGASLPEGFGALRISVAKNGSVTGAGNLGSGTPVTFSSNLNATSSWPFYFGGSAGDEIMLGTLTPSAAAKPVFSGTLDWFRAPGPDNEPYAEGFTTSAQLASSRFAPPAARYTSATITFGGAGLGAPVVIPFTLNSRGQGSGGPAGFAFSLQTSNGLFSGTFNDGAGSRVFRGVVFQADGTGAGSFTSASGAAGTVSLQKTP